MLFNFFFKKGRVLNNYRSYFRQLAIVLIGSLLLIACSGTPSKNNYRQIPSASFNDRVRYLIIHHTAIDYQKSLEALTEPDRVSAHYLIPERGDPSYTGGQLEVQQLVQEEDRAWHAGVSHWQGKSGLNDQSIGIELVHQAPCLNDENIPVANIGLNSHALANSICFYPDYDEQQIQLLIKLAQEILARHPEITPTRITGHADIAPSRRVDPGPRFPWYRLYKEGIGAWYETDTVQKYFEQFNKQAINISTLQAALKRYGYGIVETGVLDPQTINVLTVFQMHFRPWEVTGKPDDKTVATVFALLQRYMPKHAENLLARHQQEHQANQAKQTKKSGQLNLTLAQSSRSEVSFRSQFRAYSGQSSIALFSENNLRFDLLINGKRVIKQLNLTANKSKSIAIGNYITTGNNQIRLESISNQEATVLVQVPYPTLNEKINSTGFSKPKLNKIDQLINKEISEGFPGAVLAVIKNGRLIKHTAYGYAQRYSATGEELSKPDMMTKDSVFDLASNTKMYATNYALMKLASEGRLDVSKPIQTYIPEYQGNGRESRTVKDLLNHTAGYAPSVAFYDQNQTGNSGLFSQNPTRTRQLLATRVPFKMGRGIKAVYSDTDYMLLGLIVERITGLQLDRYVEEHIYLPLGLQKTQFNPLQKGINTQNIAATELAGNSRGGRISFENIRTDVIRGQVHDEKAFYAMQGIAGHAGLFSNALEVSKLAMILLNRGGYGDVQLFDASQMDQFLKPSDLDVTTGLGWRRAGNGQRAWQFGPYASPYAIGHTGWTGTVTVIDPLHDLVIVLLTNKKHTPIVEKNGSLRFLGDGFETGKYGSIISLVYEAFLDAQ